METNGINGKGPKSSIISTDSGKKNDLYKPRNFVGI